MKKSINKIIKDYRNLKDKLICPGHEVSMDEVMWNDGIFESMDELLESLDEETRKQIKLNLL